MPKPSDVADLDAGSTVSAAEIERMRLALAEQIRRADEQVAEIARLRRAYEIAVRSLCERHWKLRAASRWKIGLFRMFGLKLRDRDLVRNSIFFDPDWYVAQYPEVATSGLGPAQHYCKIGARKGFAPGPLFSGESYQERNPDAADASVSNLAHFEIHGRKEGRGFKPPDFAQDLVFDPPPVPRAKLFSRGWGALRKRFAGAPDSNSYGEWVAKFDTLTEEDRVAIASHIRRLAFMPRFSILLDARDADRQSLHKAIDSIRRQIYPDWELLPVVDSATPRRILQGLEDCRGKDARIGAVQCAGEFSAAANLALEQASGAFVTLLRGDHLLAEQALYEVAVELNQRPDAEMIYSDQDGIDRRGRRSRPFFKTDWNPELFLAFDMVNPLGVYRRSLIAAAGGFRENFAGQSYYELALRTSAAAPAGTIRHIPAILCHCLDPGLERGLESGASGNCRPGGSREREAMRGAKNAFLAKRGENAEAAPHPLKADWDVIIRRPPRPCPLVSVIVPTRDRADLLSACVAGVLERTNDVPVELIVIDHDSRERATIDLFERLAKDPRVRILKYSGAFNYSDMNNCAAATARGELLCFLNNDVEVIGADWLKEMAALAILPANGAVGAKLLYPDGRLQHGGVLVGIGAGADHLHRFAAEGDPGYCGRLALATNISAVTAACLVVRKALFQQVGGFDAEHFKVAFNDIDLCLKIQAAGYRNVWTPRALLYHHESLSRGSDEARENRDRFWSESRRFVEKWAALMANDPYFNPNFREDDLHFKPAFPPRRQKPWRTEEQTAR